MIKNKNGLTYQYKKEMLFGISFFLFWNNPLPFSVLLAHLIDNLQKA